MFATGIQVAILSATTWLEPGVYLGKHNLLQNIAFFQRTSTCLRQHPGSRIFIVIEPFLLVFDAKKVIIFFLIQPYIPKQVKT